MKKLTILISLMICSFSAAYSQQKLQTDTIDAASLKHPHSNKGQNIYIKDNSLNKYVGTWVGHYKNNSFKLVLKKYTHVLNNTSLELLTGGYQCIKNGREIYSLSDDSLKASSGGKRDTLNIFIDVKSLKTRIDLLAIYLNNGAIELQLNNNRFESKNDESFELPMPLILTKQ